MTLLLVCRQIHEEVLDHFFSLTTFEVGPLTPHHDEWRMDPTYQKLRNSVHLSRVQKLKVRVNLERMQMASSEGLSNHDGARFSEIGLEECVLKVQPLSEMLVRVLRNGAKNLKMITIDWKDEFPEDINWQLKSSVLFPFGNLEGVQFRLGRVKMADRARTAYEERLKETLEGLSA
ncbi:hypothetical protein K469DRAFT_202677 [Zopfia rhizophila CBS 207.26]|uniref:Uncharacterized protein n=1 Tax=Zopfia rhizophila CBS 207.26 TaxID=1314779 RepID=A0A6A6DW12_9PEZI|nr:hypothetical protein K469DRAFT_202677 [Zopfia rhizophila CBS 207.26]